jgi:hypothetical protein
VRRRRAAIRRTGCGGGSTAQKDTVDREKERVKGELERVGEFIRNTGDTVTDQVKRAEAALREEAERLKRLGDKVEETAVPIITQGVGSILR